MQEPGQVVPVAVPLAVEQAGRVSQARRALFWAVLVSVLLLVLPWVWPTLAWLAWPQAMGGALAHELGHGFMTMVAGGSLDSLQLFADASGVAHTRTSGGAIARALVAAGGPFGPPLLAMVLFVAAREARMARAALVLIALLLTVALVLWVRNLFGGCFVALCAGVIGFAAWRLSRPAAQALTCFLAVQLCLSSLARIDYLFSASARTGAGEMASDTMQIGQQLGGPHGLWGALVLLVSLGVMGAGLWWFLRGLRRADAVTAG